MSWAHLIEKRENLLIFRAKKRTKIMWNILQVLAQNKAKK